MNNNKDNMKAEIRQESTRHVFELNRIADKYGIDVKDLIIGDCATITVSLLIMGYGDKLTAQIAHLSKK